MNEKELKKLLISGETETLEFKENFDKETMEAGLPEPKFEEYQGFRVIFRKDAYTEEYLRDLGLNERQIKAVHYVKEKGKITNKEYRELVNTTQKTASRDLVDLVSKKIFNQVGTTGKGTFYILKETKET